MPSTVDRFEADISRLVQTGGEMERALIEKGNGPAPTTFDEKYQAWYSEAHEVVRQLLPNRLKDFELLYHDPAKGKDITQSFGIREWVLGQRIPRVPNVDGSLQTRTSCRQPFCSSSEFRRRVLNVGRWWHLRNG